MVCDRLLIRRIRTHVVTIGRYTPQRRIYAAQWPHLLDGLDRLDEQTIQSRTATGLDGLVRPARDRRGKLETDARDDLVIVG